MRNLAFPLLLVLLAGCGGESLTDRRAAAAAAVAGATPAFSILEREMEPPRSYTARVRIEKPASEAELRNIAAQVLVRQGDRAYERTLIFYYLPGQDPHGAAWATSHYVPDLTVSIAGNSAEQLSTLQAKPAIARADLVGSWLDNRSGVANRIDIYREGNGYKMTRTFAGETRPAIAETVREKAMPLGREFRVEGDPAAKYMRINGAGDLEAYDADGMIFKANKVDS